MLTRKKDCAGRTRGWTHLWRHSMQPVYKARQKGVTIIGFILFGGLAVLLAIEAVRAYPALLEYYQVQRAIVYATQNANNPAEIRKIFDNNAVINNISAVAGSDLEIEKAGTGYVASVSYTAWINLFKNVNLVIEFTATSQPRLDAPSK